MITVLVSLTAFFCISNIYQLYIVQRQIQRFTEVDLKENFITPTIEDNGSANNATSNTHLKMLANLERFSIQNRYRQANIMMMNSMYLSYMGFVTGMILALVGAAFVLGKLREPETSVGSETPVWKFSLASTSPGLILAVLGSALMSITILDEGNINVRDTPLYLDGNYIQAPLQESRGKRIITPTLEQAPKGTPINRTDDRAKILKRIKEAEEKANKK